jgi:FAD dependent oxidoreductase
LIWQVFFLQGKFFFRTGDIAQCFRTSNILMDSQSKKMGRRSFLKGAGMVIPVIMASPKAAIASPIPASASPASLHRKKGKEMAADLVVIGGGLGGCAAALAAARNGLRVILTEETDWIGGQLTQQAVPPDENPWIESFGGTRSFLELRKRIREYYVRNYPLTEHAKKNALLNPGNGWVSRLCHEPKVALAVLTDMLAPYVGSNKVQILTRHKAVSAAVQGDRVEAVKVVGLDSGNELILHAPYFADATELGDLLPMTKTEYVVGAEAQSETGEPNAPAKANPRDMQGFTMCFAMDYLPDEDHTIDKPRDYEFWRNQVPKRFDGTGARLISFDEPSSKKIGFDPVERKGFWTYRRIADRDNFERGFYSSDICLVNWPQNDYSLGVLCDVSESEAARHIRSAKQQSLSLLYWLQTEAPRPDGGTGWKGLRLRPDIVGTEDGLAKYPYIRESRRIRAEFTILEQHVATELRMKETGLSKEEVTAAPFKDSVGIGSYRIDVHATTSGNAGVYQSTVPFQISLGALIPKRMENLLPACKNLGVTHITNGCYREHPTEWNIGESVGMLVAYCLKQHRVPREVRNREELLTDFQQALDKDGVPINWSKGKIWPI